MCFLLLAFGDSGRITRSRADLYYIALLLQDGTVSAEIAADVVVWNPHVNKAQAMGDFDDEGWTAMACVEPGVVAADRPGINPGGSLVLSQTIAPED